MARLKKPASPPESITRSALLRTGLGAGLIVLATVTAYCNSFNGPFVFDDKPSIVKNPEIQTIATALTGPFMLTRPVLALSLALNYSFGKLEPIGYHVFNLLVHICAALTLFGILRRMLQSERCRLSAPGGAAPAQGDTAKPLFLNSRTADVIACLAALIWAVHPLQTASVTYVIQRAESLMGLFYLLTLYCYIRGCFSRRSTLWFAAAILFSMLGMGTKQVMVTVPVMVWLYDRTFIAGSLGESLRRRWKVLAALALTAGIVPLLFALNPRPLEGVLSDAPMSSWEYLLTQCGVLLHYLRLSVWPVHQCLDYNWPVTHTLARAWPAGAVVLGLLGLTGWALFKRPALGFLGAWFFVILAPTSSFIRFTDAAFEHRMYLPLAAVVLLLVWAVRDLARSAAKTVNLSVARGATLGLAAAVVIALCLLTRQRNTVFADEMTVWQDTIDQSAHNPRAHHNYGNAFLACREQDLAQAAACHQCKDFAAEEKWLKRADEDQENAFKYFDLAIEYDSKYYLAYFGRAFVLSDRARAQSARGDKQGAAGSNAQALEDYSAALKFKPNYDDAYNNRGNTYMALGKLDLAIHDYSEALKIQEAWDAYWNRGNCHETLKEHALAIRDYDAALRLRPGFPDIYRSRAIAYFNQREYAEALADVRACTAAGGTVDDRFLEALKTALGGANR